MKSNVSFYTTIFESKNSQPQFINNRCFGEDLAKWLRNRLKSDFSLSEPYQEDWGWQIKAVMSQTILISVGIMDDSIGSEKAEWLIMIEQRQPWFSFKKADFGHYTAFCNEIDKTLRSEKKITQIRWDDLS